MYLVIDFLGETEKLKNKIFAFLENYLFFLPVPNLDKEEDNSFYYLAPIELYCIKYVSS